MSLALSADQGAESAATVETIKNVLTNVMENGRIMKAVSCSMEINDAD